MNDCFFPQFSFFWYVGSHGNVAVAVLVTVPVTLTVAQKLEPQNCAEIATTTLQHGGHAWAVVTATKKNCAVVTAGRKDRKIYKTKTEQINKFLGIL